MYNAYTSRCIQCIHENLMAYTVFSTAGLELLIFNVQLHLCNLYVLLCDVNEDQLIFFLIAM